MRLNACSVLAALTMLLCAAPWAASQNVVASDNADFPEYGPFPNNNWSAINGNSPDRPGGYNLWTVLGNSATNTRFMASSGRQAEGNFSFGLTVTNLVSAISRPLGSTISGNGQFEIITRFEVANTLSNSLHAVNLRAGNITSSFASGEQLAFGLLATNVLGYRDFSGTHQLAVFDAGTNAWKWKLAFNTLAGTYSGVVMTNENSGVLASWNGVLELNDTLGPVDSFAVISSGTGNVIFDAPQFSVPEPAAVSIGAVAIGALIFWRRRGDTEANAQSPA